MMLMMEFIFLEYSPTPLAMQLISHKLNMPINVPTAPKISPNLLLVRCWSSSKDSMMLLITLAILVLAVLTKLVLI